MNITCLIFWEQRNFTIPTLFFTEVQDTNTIEEVVHESSSGGVDEEEPIFAPGSVHSFHEPGSVHSFHDPGSVENLHDMDSIVVQEEVVETSEAHDTQGDDDADTDYSPEETNQVGSIIIK